MKYLAIIFCLISNLAFAQQRVDFAPMSPVELIKPSGRIVPYGKGASSDVVRGTALIAAVTASTAGDTVKMNTGSFDIDTAQINLPDDVSLIGLGREATKIISGRDGFADGVSINPGNNSYVANFTIDTTEILNGRPFGVTNDGNNPDTDFTGVVIENVHFDNRVDALFVYAGAAGTTDQTYEMTAINCTGLGSWDFINANVQAIGNTASVTLVNCRAVADGTIYSQSNSRCISCGINSTLRVIGGTYTVSGGSSSNVGAACFSGTMTLENVTIETSGTSALDITRTGGTANVFGGKGSGTGGAFTTSGTINFVAGDRVIAEINSGTAGGITGSKVATTTTTTRGVAELAIASEITAGSDTSRVIGPNEFRQSDYGKRVVTIPVSDPSGDDLTTGDGKNYWRVPAILNGWNIVAVAGHVTTVSSSGLPTFQIHNVTDTVDVLSTRITIDANEKDSSTAAAAAVINTSNDDVATADELRIDADVAGTGTKGASVEITFQKP